MADEVKEAEKRAEILKAKNAALDQEVSEAEKKARIAELKRQYGKDWKKMLGGAFKRIKVDKETMLDMHSLGGNNQTLRDMSNPALLRRYK